MIDKTEQDAPYGSVALPLGELLFDGGDARDFPAVLDVVACAATLHAPRGFSARLVAHDGGGLLELMANDGQPVPFGLMDALLALVTAEESSEVARWLAGAHRHPRHVQVPRTDRRRLERLYPARGARLGRADDGEPGRSAEEPSHAL